MTFASTSTKARARRLAAAAAAAALALGSAPCLAQGYDEAISGDLSNNGLAPTVVTFTIGDNVIRGTTGHDVTGAPDRDYFTFTIAPGTAVTAIDILPGTQTLGFSFIGLQAGTQVTLPTNAATAAGLLGWTHYDASDVGTDILDDMSVAANGSSGFSGPLGPGSYAVWVQEISPGGTVPYAFDFMVAQVPEPSTWAMMLGGFGLLGLAFRRRRAGANRPPAGEAAAA